MQFKKTVSVTNGSPTVVVTGADVRDDVHAGYMFLVRDEWIPYNVASEPTYTGGNSYITLTSPYAGTTSVSANGVFVVDFTLPDQIPTISQGDVGTAVIFTQAMQRIQAIITGGGAVQTIADGTVSAPGQRFTSEHTTGVYRPTVGQWALTILGAQKLLVTGTGLNATAIGSTTPSTAAFTTLSASGASTLAAITGTTLGLSGAASLAAVTLSSVNKLVVTPPTSIATLTLADGSHFVTSGPYTATLTATADTSLTLPTSGTLASSAHKLSFFSPTSSAELAGVISDETGSGSLVFNTNANLITPTLGVAAATTINKVAITAPATSATLALYDGSSFHTVGAHSVTLTSTGTTNVTLPDGGTLATLASVSQTFLGDTHFDQNVTVNGDLTVNGTTTTVNSTSVTLDDPVITLGGDTAPTVDDNKDRGVEFRWHDGSSAKRGFFGFDDSTGKFTFITDAVNSGEVFSGTPGDVVLGSGSFSGSVSATAGFTGNLTGNVTGNVTGALTGNASTATALQTARNINGVSFNGTADITIGSAAGTLTGTTLASNVVTSSLTAVATITTGVWNASVVGMTYGGSGKNLTPANGGLVYTDVDSMEILAPTATAGQMLRSGANAAPAWSSATFPTNATANRILFASATDTWSQSGSGLTWDGTTLTANALAKTTAIGASSAAFTGAVSAGSFSGPLTGAVTGNVTGNLTGNVTGAVTGNASTATTLATSRNLNGTAFNGSANIIVRPITGVFGGTADASTITFADSTVTTLGNDFRFTGYSVGANTLTVPTIVVTLGTTALTAKNIVKGNNVPLKAGDIPGANYPCDLQYSTAWGAFVLLNPSSVGSGATGGGTDLAFFENDQVINSDYTITPGKNAFSTGPMTVASTATVTVGAGQTWLVLEV